MPQFAMTIRRRLALLASQLLGRWAVQAAAASSRLGGAGAAAAVQTEATAHADAGAAATLAAQSSDAAQRMVKIAGEIDVSSRRMADISALINAGAFQAKLTALSAALEAAREMKALLEHAGQRAPAGKAQANGPANDAGHAVQAIAKQVHQVSARIKRLQRAPANPSEGGHEVNPGEKIAGAGALPSRQR